MTDPKLLSGLIGEGDLYESSFWRVYDGFYYNELITTKTVKEKEAAGDMAQTEEQHKAPETDINGKEPSVLPGRKFKVNIRHIFNELVAASRTM